MDARSAGSLHVRGRTRSCRRSTDLCALDVCVGCMRSRWMCTTQTRSIAGRDGLWLIFAERFVHRESGETVSLSERRKGDVASERPATNQHSISHLNGESSPAFYVVSDPVRPASRFASNSLDCVRCERRKIARTT